MSDVREVVRGQRGVALVVALLVLVFLSILASSFMMTMTVETKIAGETTREARALNTAEAGIAEALQRIRVGDVADDLNPKDVSLIFLATPGNVPVVGADTTALPTYQDASKWLTYSTTTRSTDVLTVTYKTDAQRTKIYRYDSTKNPAIQTTTGSPIYVVTSTGRYSDAKRTVVTEVIQQTMPTYLKAAGMGKHSVHIIADTYFCGYNHRSDTPDWTAMDAGRSGSATSCNPDLANQKWEVGTDNTVGAWSEAKVSDTKKGGQWGVPVGYQQNQVGFYSGPWDVFAMTRAEFFQFVGAPIKNVTTLTGTFQGIKYYDPDGKVNTNGTKLQMRSLDGDGFLYIDGDAEIKGQVTWRGLIYCTGTLTVSGKAWVLGAVVCGKDLFCHNLKNDFTILYSKQTIENEIAKYGSPFITLSWREKP